MSLPANWPKAAPEVSLLCHSSEQQFARHCFQRSTRCVGSSLVSYPSVEDFTPRPVGQFEVCCNASSRHRLLCLNDNSVSQGTRLNESALQIVRRLQHPPPPPSTVTTRALWFEFITCLGCSSYMRMHVVWSFPMVRYRGRRNWVPLHRTKGQEGSSL